MKMNGLPRAIRNRSAVDREYVRRSWTLREKRPAYVGMRRVDVFWTRQAGWHRRSFFLSQLFDKLGQFFYVQEGFHVSQVQTMAPMGRSTLSKRFRFIIFMKKGHTVMKKYFAMLLAVAMLLTACGGDSNTSENTGE